MILKWNSSVELGTDGCKVEKVAVGYRSVEICGILVDDIELRRSIDLDEGHRRDDGGGGVEILRLALLLLLGELLLCMANVRG